NISPYVQDDTNRFQTSSNGSICSINTIEIPTQDTHESNDNIGKQNKEFPTSEKTIKSFKSETKKESDVEMSITLIWCILVEGVVITGCGVAYYLNRNEQAKNYFVSWLSCSSFNFIIYNIRIPAFRKRTMDIILTIPRKLANAVSRKIFGHLKSIILDAWYSAYGWCSCKTGSWDNGNS
ncbi:unnamed protein product, partial [Meganyctiphanes norvegica]